MDIEILANEWIENVFRVEADTLMDGEDICRMAFRAGYKAAQQSVQADECPEGGLHKFPFRPSSYSQYCEKCGTRRPSLLTNK